MLWAVLASLAIPWLHTAVEDSPVIQGLHMKIIPSSKTLPPIGQK
jgi:hypothetical protein